MLLKRNAGIRIGSIMAFPAHFRVVNSAARLAAVPFTILLFHDPVWSEGFRSQPHIPPIAPPVAPQPAQQTLMQALAEAYRTNPNLLAARARLRGVDEGVTQAASPWRPHVTLDTQAGGALYDNRIDKLHVPEHRAPQDYQLRFGQDIYTSGRVESEVQQAKARVAAERGVLAAAEATVLLDAGTAYLDVVQDRALLAVQRHAVEIADRTVRASSVETASGTVAPAQLAQEQARLTDAQAEVATLIAQLQTSEATYEQQIGHPPGAVVLSDHSFPVPAGRDLAITMALDNNPDLVAARGTLDALRLGIDIAKDSLLPQVSINAVLERRRQYEYETYAQRENIAQGLLEVTIPIYQGGLEYSRIRQAKEQTEYAENLVQRAVRAARRDAISAWAELEAAKDRFNRYQQAQRAYEVARDGVTRQQRVGARTAIDVLNAEQAVLESEANTIRAGRELQVQALRLLDVVGDLNAADLQLDTPVYDPTRHYDEVRNKWIGTKPPPEPRP